MPTIIALMARYPIIIISVYNHFIPLFVRVVARLLMNGGVPHPLLYNIPWRHTELCASPC